MAVMLWWALAALGPERAATDAVPVPARPASPSTTTATPTSETTAVAADVVSLVPSAADGPSPRPAIDSARVLKDTIPEWPIVSSETGFLKIGTQGGDPTALISPNGLWWDSNLAVPMRGINFDHPIVAIEASPDWAHLVAIYRSPQGFVVTRSTNNADWLPPVTLETPAPTKVLDLVVGSEVAYVSFAGPAIAPTGEAGSIFIIDLDGALDVNVLDQLATFDLVTLESGTALADGSLAARGTAADGASYLLHIRAEDEISIGEYTGEGFATARLLARGSTLVISEADGRTSQLRFDKAPTERLGFSLDPMLSKSNGDVLVSVQHGGDQTVLLAWWGDSIDVVEIALGSGVQIDEIVSFNTNEVLLATTTDDGQRWLANVPLR